MKEQEYKLVLGLEIHLHLKTSHKMFCGCSTDIYDAHPNTRTCPVCLGLPGALPVPNYDAVRKAQLLGLSLNCSLNKHSRFDRKHYFYPDLPKGYQISQYKQPFSENGYLTLENGKKMELERVHLEEDTAKSFHQGDKTLIDFNKSGMPLVEIVTKPIFTNVVEAVEFCKKIQTIVRFLDIADVDMEKGQMRLEANISLRTADMELRNELAKYKVEIKNINSFKFMEKAVLAEVQRQSEILNSGGQVMQENRGYNESTGKTVSQRSKEEAHDYRYFPEPDIPPMVFDDKYIAELKNSLCQLPHDAVIELVNDYKIDKESAEKLVYVFGKQVLERYKEIVKLGGDAKKSANYLLNKKDYQDLSPQDFIVKLKSEQNKNVSTQEMAGIVDKIIQANEKAVADYKKGNMASIEYLLGMVMRETKGTADPKTARDTIIKALE